MLNYILQRLDKKSGQITDKIAIDEQKLPSGIAEYWEKLGEYEIITIDNTEIVAAEKAEPMVKETIQNQLKEIKWDEIKTIDDIKVLLQKALEMI